MTDIDPDEKGAGHWNIGLQLDGPVSGLGSPIKGLVKRKNTPPVGKNWRQVYG